MAQDIHPKMNEVVFQFSQGREMKMPSTYKKSPFLMETDIFIHPAWREDQKVVHAGSGNVAKFNQTFGGFSFAQSLSTMNTKTENAVEETKEVKKTKKKKEN